MGNGNKKQLVTDLQRVRGVSAIRDILQHIVSGSIPMRRRRIKYNFPEINPVTV